MTEIIGLDSASDRWHALGLVPRYQSQLKGGAWKGADIKRPELYRTALAYFIERLVLDDIHVFCEEPLALQNGATTRKLSMACGVIWLAAKHAEAKMAESRLQWTWVDVSHWKRVIVGNGNADKEMIKDWVRADMADGLAVPVVFDLEVDLYDAYCLRRYGQIAIAMGQEPARLGKKKRSKRKK